MPEQKAQEPRHAVAAPSISLPKGGGAIHGIGEKFSANPVTGTGSLSVPIPTSAGRNGFGPQLSLSYDSGSGNGPFGFGWSLALPAIARKTDKGLPRYDESDVYLSGAEDLVPGEEHQRDGYHVRRYRPRIEGSFARIERWRRDADGDVHWRSLSKDNVLTVYGQDAQSRIADPDDGARIFSWLICESRDDRGNAVLYRYVAEDGTGVDLARAHERNRGPRDDGRRTTNRYLKSIRYGNRVPLLDGGGQRPRVLEPAQIAGAGWMFEVVLDYGEHHADDPKPGDVGEWDVRQDAFSSYRSGFEVRTQRLCRRVLMFHHFPDEPELGNDCLVRSTSFDFHETAAGAFLIRATQSGFRRAEGGGYDSRSTPPAEFEYSKPVLGGDVLEIEPRSLENLPAGIHAPFSDWVDLDGEGLSGVLTEQDGGWYYKRNESALLHEETKPTYAARFAPVETVALVPGGGSETQFLDLAGDGQVDVVAFDPPVPGFYERTHSQEWASFRTFLSVPNIAWDDPNLKFIDLTGDGHADLLITAEHALTWYPSLAEDGFGGAMSMAVPTDEEQGPRVVFADGTETIFLADLSGDGLTDIARIRNGEVCYWPNLGYGRFGAKVTMDDAPWLDAPDQFDARRLRLVDIDGSGVTDIIYLGRQSIRFWMNQSGNGWSEGTDLPSFPSLDDVSNVAAVDLLGNGTACLVWSSALPGSAGSPARYIPLMAAGKPHLLIAARNNLGSETRVHYAPSTYFYLRDKYDGRPWLTKLPFPVHVVERVETFDHISGNRFTTRYAYHHGYFDGIEREFRGFAMVEQWDTEVFSALAGGTNVDVASHLPPVHIKTWFHTGAAAGSDHVADFFGQALLLPDTTIPALATLDEERQALRALKGKVLRQEIYARDAGPKNDYPYVVTEQNYTVRLLQAAVGNGHAVFVTYDRESIKAHYERNPDDPRVSHEMTLDVDDYGNVRLGASIGYGRNPGHSPLDGDDRRKQEQFLFTYAESEFTNSIDDVVAYPDHYRAPHSAEARTYEVTGLAMGEGETRFSWDDLAENDCAALRTLPDVGYEVPADFEKKRRRIIECVRALYRKDDLSALLPKGEVEALAVSGEIYKLALTEAMLGAIFVRDGEQLLPDPAAVLGGGGGERGGYVDLDVDGRWWIPSGRTYLSPGSADSAAEELAHARQHFFLPRRYRDPFHTNAFSTENLVTFDAYDLLVEETRDAAGNRVTVGERLENGDRNPNVRGNDYRTLLPRRVMDPNRNRSQVAFDILGMVTGTAVMGKPEETAGDSLVDFESDLAIDVALDHIAHPLADPHAILGRATTRLVYDLFAYERSKDQPQPQPAVVYTLTRETHHADLPENEKTKIQHRFSYSDGFGREIQVKIQAEPRKVGGVPGDPRWIGSGWTIFNNKGKPVRHYHPFFSKLPVAEGHRFEFGVEAGVSPILFYDPIGRVVAVIHPNHSYEKVLFDAWHQVTYDVNDTVLGDPRTDDDVKGLTANYFADLEPDPGNPWKTWHQQRKDGDRGVEDQRAAVKAAAHHNTPTTAHLDALGRAFLTLVHNGFKPDQSPILLASRVEVDIEANHREVRDPVVQDGDGRGRVVARYDFDLLGTRIREHSMDAGMRWLLNDVGGKPLRVWNSRGHRARTEYDPLRRPRRTLVLGADPLQPGQEIVTDLMIYGEVHPQREARNLMGKLFLHFDQAGAAAIELYDFKGNPARTSRRLAKEYRKTLGWTAADVAQIGDLEAAVAPFLEDDAYVSLSTFDALNRVVTMTTPHTPAMKFSTIRPRYNEAGLFDGVEANLRGAAVDDQPLWTPFITDVQYTPKRKRKLIDYATKDGKVVTTVHTYERETCRVLHTYTRRGVDPVTRDAVAFDEDCDNPAPPPATIGAPAAPADGQSCGLQNLHYTYDPLGNITHIRDDARQFIYFRNKRVEPGSDYTYDPLYRLIEATGREHLGQIGGTPIAHSHNDAPRVGIDWAQNDGNAVGTYVERYRYDDAGNLVDMEHAGSDPVHPGWTRHYVYAEESLIEGAAKTSNRLTHTKVGAGPEERYLHDVHGNVTRMPHLGGVHPDPNMHWDYRDQLRSADLGGGGTAWFVYDGGSRRTRKVWEKNANLIEERIYFSGFEIFRRRNAQGVVKLERETLHIVDDHHRIALIETRTVDVDGNDPAPEQLIRYQFVNHLASTALELDDAAQIVSYEEYSPFGSTTYQAVRSLTDTPKRYRYTGNERDEESGLEYHQARYYAPWLGRWASADPIGIRDGLNVFAYVKNNPVIAKDDSGLSDEGVTKIADWLQSFVDAVPEDEWLSYASDPEWNTTTPSTRGTRYHTVMEAAIEFGWENNSGADPTRVLSELHIDTAGNISAINTPPGAASTGYRTADIGILKEGQTRELIAERLKAGEKIKASDVLDVAIDYKTGQAALKKKARFEALSGVPYEKLSKGGNLAKTVGDALQRFGNPIKASAIPSVPTKAVTGAVGTSVALLALLKPVAAVAGPAGDVFEAGMAAKTIAEAPEDQRAKVAAEESGGFAGGLVGAGGAGVLAATFCATGWGCLVVGILAVGAGGYFGDMGGRATGGAIHDTVTEGIGSQEDYTLYSTPP